VWCKWAVSGMHGAFVGWVGWGGGGWVGVGGGGVGVSACEASAFGSKRTLGTVDPGFAL
jgi:hypothetical protein